MNKVKSIYSAVLNLLALIVRKKENENTEHEDFAGQALLTIQFKEKTCVTRDRQDRSVANLLIYARAHTRVETVISGRQTEHQKVSWLQLRTLYGIHHPPIGITITASKPGVSTGVYRYMEVVRQGEVCFFGISGNTGTSSAHQGKDSAGTVSDYTEEAKEYRIDPQLSNVTVVRDDQSFLEGSFDLTVHSDSGLKKCTGRFRIPKQHRHRSPGLEVSDHAK
ncbi:hypothetical protein [Arcticibacter sp. MXS-1]|uniref:hypothetical protein n=1 Tax=Arcticibacter sp. MXS-1 TaxID=3341726 RepID=UPI0035A94947